MSETERHAWIQLALTPYIGADSFLRLIQHFGSANAALQAPADDIRQIAIKGKQAAALWHNTHAAQHATEAALKWAEQSGCHLVLLGDEHYPIMLTEGMTPPPLLFARGNLGLLQRPAVSIVGSRHASTQAMRNAYEFAQALSEQHITVISGMAAGIDTAAHSGALGFSGSTIAVWGTGIDRIYPPENKELAHQIAETGLIVSEFPLGTRPMAGNFPRRNRIIAAQAQATLVVEATLNSGSLITARLASEMGREVMAIPSNIDNARAKGCHKLIKDGAKLVECLDDILQECPNLLAAQEYRQPENPKNHNLIDSIVFTPVDLPQIQIKPNSQYSQTQQKQSHLPDHPILNLMAKMGKHEAVHPDWLAEQTQIPTDELYAQLLEWELDGVIVAQSGGRYQLV